MDTKMDFNFDNLNYYFDDFIGIFENAFTKKECKDVIKSFEIFNKNKLTYTRDNLINTDDLSIDVNYIIELEIEMGFYPIFMQRFFDFLYPIYLEKYPILETLSRHMPRYMKVQKTIPTQGYHTWHSEFNGNNDCRDRVLSWILYLNDIEDGGETEFLYQSFRVKPKAGTFIIFPAYFTHTHRGNPPLCEEKYIATGWVDFLTNNQPQGKIVMKDFKIDKSKNEKKDSKKKSIFINYL